MGKALWIFGYGSLIWNPGFEVAEMRLAQLEGWARSFCMWSVQYRGTPEVPGLVLALRARAGARCQGVALRVAPGAESQTLADLRARELVTSAYLERELPLQTDAGPLRAYAYVIDPAHPQYAMDLTPEAQAQIIARAQGSRGPNRDYLHATFAHLTRLGIHDPDLAWLEARVCALGRR